MAKKVKNRARSGQKAKHSPATSPKTVTQTVTSNVEASEDGLAVIKDRELCLHINKEINLNTLSAKLGSLESYKCEDCHQGKKGKGKHVKKGATSSKSESKSIWVCLECGHFSCGGTGLPNTPQSHAVRHAKTNRHPLVLHYRNHQLLWCFPCNKLVSADKSVDNKLKEVLRNIVKMLRGQQDEGPGADVEDVWFGSGSVSNAIMSDYSVNKGAGYSVRGLINLGNTCFFNSIMQNILAIKILRDHFLKSNESSGPLSAALRKLFLETGVESNSRSAVNPRSLFGSLCTKAPQFKGYQQHDSQELLRCLLDALASEESSARKHIDESPQGSQMTSLTFVEEIFGGQLSSTVTCSECRHSSTVFEPFLDLSLPVPTKKSPTQSNKPLTRSKKLKFPPKRSGRSLSKSSRVSVEAESVSNESTSGNEIKPRIEPTNQLMHISGESASSDPIDATGIAFDMGLKLEDLSTIQKPESLQEVENVTEQSATLDCFSWLDYLGPDPVCNDVDDALETDEISGINGFTNEGLQNDISCSIVQDSSTTSNLVNAIETTFLYDLTEFNACQPVISAQGHPRPEFEEIPNANSLVNEIVERYDENIGCNSGLCDQYEESNTSQRDNEDHSNTTQASDIITLPIEDASSRDEVLKEEVHDSSAVVCEDEQDSLGFNVFGGLFDEPDLNLELKSSGGHVSESSHTNAKVANGHSSDSEANEVDDEDTPVSVESCLAFFTKLELLSKDEHAWRCDNCSKILREQRMASMKKLKKITPNGFEYPKPNGIMDQCMPSADKNVDKDVPDNFDSQTLTINRETFSNEECTRVNPKTEMIATSSPNSEKTSFEITDPCHDPSEECSSSLRYENRRSNIECDMDESAETESVVKEEEDKEKVNLENLKVKRDATKSILINKTPPILTIHLKRFGQDARGRLSKLNGHVNFKETIDLKPYMDSRDGDKEICKYRLVGVVEHLGTMRGGHYVAYVRSHQDTWYHASDAYVREASLEEVLRCEAYILFYEGN